MDLTRNNQKTIIRISGNVIVLDELSNTISINGVKINMGAVDWMTDAVSQGKIFKFYMGSSGELNIHDLTGLLEKTDKIS